MSNLRIVRDNWIGPGFLENDYASSERAGFPKENAYNGERRAKVWRSDGAWRIVSGDNTIVFRETGAGPDLTATVADDEYSSSTAFFAAVKAALEAAGDSTYTVQADATTGRVKITSNGAGGGGILTLRWTDAGSADMAAILGFDTAADDTGALTYEADELRIHTGEALTWDLGLPGNPRVFLLVGPRNAPLKLTPGATIKVQGSSTNAWDTPEYTNTLTYDSRLLQLWDDVGFHSGPLRYWRVSFQDVANPYGYIEVGFVALGDYVTTDRGCAGFPMRVQKRDATVTVFSEGGQSYSDRGEQADTFNLDWNGLTIADKELLEGVYDEHGTHTALFFAFDPLAVFGTDSTVHVRLCKFNEPLEFELVSPGNFGTTTVLREEL